MKRFTTLFLTAIILTSVFLFGCAETGVTEEGSNNEWKPVDSMELMFAEQFTVDYYPDGFKLITIAEKDKFLVVPEGAELPSGISDDIVPLYQPLENIYNAATPAMCQFDAMDRLDNVSFTSTEEDSWYIENVSSAMKDGSIVYAGKYDAPDYELLLSSDCPLAIESLMIEGAAEVREKLEEIGIPVLVDKSSLESHPLGRSEWVKLYAALVNEEEKAEQLFDRQVEYMNTVMSEESTEKTVVFFHINSSGAVVVRKSSDYMSRMIELAGGKYVFDNMDESEASGSTVTLDMEAFFDGARDADYVIYNSTLGGDPASIDELVEKNELLAQFKAFKEGNVWCTGKNLYQDTMNLGQMIESFHKIFTGEADGMESLPFFNRLR